MSAEVLVGLAAVLAAAQAASGSPAVQLSAEAQRGFARKLALAVRSRLAQVPRDGQKLIVAHGLFESGWGQGWAAQHANNPFNLTWHSSFTLRPYVRQENADWSAPDAQGHRVRIAQNWLVFGSLEAAVDGYWWFLGPTVNGGRYVTARDALAGGALLEAALRLRSAGYYTASAQEYTAGLSVALARLEREVQW